MRRDDPELVRRQQEQLAATQESAEFRRHHPELCGPEARAWFERVIAEAARESAAEQGEKT